MTKVVPEDSVPADEARDAFPVPGSSLASSGGDPTSSESSIASQIAKSPRTIDRAKMNMRRGSRRVIQLFDTKPPEEAAGQLDLDQFYKARLRRRTHLEKEITGTLTRGGIDPATERTRTRGIMMSLSPGEEYENYHKVDLATKFQQASLLEEEDDIEEDGLSAMEAVPEEGNADTDRNGDDSEGQSPLSAPLQSEDPKRRWTMKRGSVANGPMPSDKNDKSLVVPSTLGNVNSPTLRRMIRRNTIRAQAKAFSKSKKMINPHGRIRLVWDLSSVVFILYNAFALPYRASFDPVGSGEDNFDLFLDIFFICDILVMFNTAVEIDGSVRYSRRVTAKTYLTGWFLVDTVAALPYGRIIPQQGTADASLTLLRSLKLLRLVRLLRLFRISRIFRRIQNAIFIRSTLTALGKYLLAVIFVSHWFSCVFHSIADGHSGLNWITINNLEEPHGSKWDRYVAALYFSVMTLATIGFGDIAGTNADERLFAIFAMIIGGGIFAYGITNIVELVSSLTVSETRFRQKMDEVNEYMAARELPMKVRKEIREFYHNTRESRESKLNAEQQILSEISSKLRSKIALSINDQFLRKFPFFAGSEPNFLMELALNMRMIHFAQLEDVIVEGEIGHEMFFIFRGAVEVLRGGEQIGILGENQYFGEMAILGADNRRRATVRTLCFCELRMLTRNRFIDALALFPAMQTKMAQVARARQSPRKTDAPPTTPSNGSPTKNDTVTAAAPTTTPPSQPKPLIPPPRLSVMKQQQQQPPIGDATMSAVARLTQNEQRNANEFTVVRTTTSARLNTAARRTTMTSSGTGVSASMALTLSETSSKLEEAMRRQEMLVNAISKLSAELEKLSAAD